MNFQSVWASSLSHLLDKAMVYAEGLSLVQYWKKEEKKASEGH